MQKRLLALAAKLTATTEAINKVIDHNERLIAFVEHIPCTCAHIPNKAIMLCPRCRALSPHELLGDNTASTQKQKLN